MLNLRPKFIILPRHPTDLQLSPLEGSLLPGGGKRGRGHEGIVCSGDRCHGAIFEGNRRGVVFATLVVSVPVRPMERRLK